MWEPGTGSGWVKASNLQLHPCHLHSPTQSQASWSGVFRVRCWPLGTWRFLFSGRPAVMGLRMVSEQTQVFVAFTGHCFQGLPQTSGSVDTQSLLYHDWKSTQSLPPPPGHLVMTDTTQGSGVLP